MVHICVYFYSIDPECQERTAAIGRILRVFSVVSLAVVWYLPGGDIGEMAEGTDVEVYGFYDCKNKDESNATLQSSTEGRRMGRKPCKTAVP